ncbi:MAG TPA: hypothetical protein VF473_03700 [Cyclobacteriaceae bacterium]
MKKVVLSLLAAWLFFNNAQGQISKANDSLLLKSDPIIAEMDSILNSPDSLTILDLIDSILLAPPGRLRSQMSVRVGYNNNIVANGASSFRQYGLTTGASFYHKSGAYADLASYYSRQYKPAVYLTVGALGYLGIVNKHWSVITEYDHYFYTPATGGSELYTPYTNNLYLSNYFKVKKLIFRFDYNLYFGKLYAHRFTPAIGLNLSKKKWLGLDRVTFLPSVSLWYGSDRVTEYVPNFTSRKERLLLIAQGKPLWTPKEKTAWGVVNYALSFPVSLLYKDWSLLVSYNLNFQRGLPGESISSYRVGYLSASLTRYFDL